MVALLQTEFRGAAVGDNGADHGVVIDFYINLGVDRPLDDSCDSTVEVVAGADTAGCSFKPAFIAHDANSTSHPIAGATCLRRVALQAKAAFWDGAVG